MSKKTYHSAKTGRFVSKEFMKNNPDTTVVVTNIDLKQELMDFINYAEHLILDEVTIDAYIEQR